MEFKVKLSDFEEKVTNYEGNLVQIDEGQKSVNKYGAGCHQNYTNNVEKVENIVKQINNKETRIRNQENENKCSTKNIHNINDFYFI